MYTIYVMNGFINFNTYLILLDSLGYLYHLNLTYFTIFELQSLLQFYVSACLQRTSRIKLNINGERFSQIASNIF